MSLKDSSISVWEALPANIASGASITDAINLGGLRVFGIVIPAEWTAANLTFQASFDAGATWVNIFDKAGDEFTVSASASRYVILDPIDFAAIQMLKIRSGMSATPVTQTALRDINLVLRRI